MQKKTYFAILLVAFSGLLFPPMTFAQSAVCPKTVSLGSTTFSLNTEGVSLGSDSKGGFMICSYEDPDAPKFPGGDSTVWLTADARWFFDEAAAYANVDFCTDSQKPYSSEGMRFTHSEDYTLVTIQTNAVSQSDISRDFALQFFDLSNNALSCGPSEPQQTEVEAPASQQEECRKTPNGISAKIANAVWGEPEIKIVGVFKDVQVSRDGKWLKATRGMVIHQCDVIKTGNDGRVRIEFRDPYNDWAQNSGPSVLNLSPNSAIRIGEYGIFHKDGEANQSGLLEFMYGTFRAYAKQWGKTSIFSVKAGVALCGIRGSDMIFSYDPQQERLSVLANEGTVSIQNTITGDTQNVVAGQSTVVNNGKISPVMQLSSDTWQNAVNSIVISETESSTQKNQQSDTASTSSFMDMPDMALTNQGTLNLSKDIITVIDKPISVQIHGKAAGYLPGDSIEILIETPTGTIHKITPSVASAATYVATINIEPSDPKGVYAIVSMKNGEVIAKDSLTVKDQSQSEKARGVPDWVRNNAKWWAEGQIDDGSFIQGLQFLIKEGIMTIPPTARGEVAGSGEIPDWIKNNAKWWAEGQIDDDSFIQGVQFLVKEGIMSVD